MSRIEYISIFTLSLFLDGARLCINYDSYKLIRTSDKGEYETRFVYVKEKEIVDSYLLSPFARNFHLPFVPTSLDCYQWRWRWIHWDR